MHLIRHNDTHTRISSIPLVEGSVRRRDFYVTKHTPTHKKDTHAPAGFEPGISASEWPQTCILDSAVTGIGENRIVWPIFNSSESCLKINTPYNGGLK